LARQKLLGEACEQSGAESREYLPSRETVGSETTGQFVEVFMANHGFSPCP